MSSHYCEYLVPIVEATEESFGAYGRLFRDKDSDEARVDISRWPAPGWRECHDGVSGGTTSGIFSLEWRNGAHAATNSGVANGDYLFAWTTAKAALDAAKYKQEEETISHKQEEKEARMAFTCTEINYHADGGQTFFSPDAPFICCLGLPAAERAPDDILPSDFRAFYLPPGLGCHVNAMVYHCPPIATVFDRKTIMFTEQGKVHSKFYYDPLREHNTLLKIPLEL